MIEHYFKSIFRHLLRNKANFFFKLAGLTLALSSFLVIALYVSYQLSFDRYHNEFENIYRVNTERNENGRQEKYGIAPLILGPEMGKQFPEIAAFARISISNPSHLRYHDKVVNCGVFPADSSLFDVFTFQFLKGGKDALTRPGSIVLTQSIAFKIFGNDDPLHKIITINNEKKLYEVSAVVKDMQPNSHFVVDAFIPLTGDDRFTLGNIISPVDFVDHSAVLFIRFKNTINIESFPEKLEKLLNKFVSKNDLMESGFNITLQALKDIYLAPVLKYEFTKMPFGFWPMYLFTIYFIGLL